MNWLNKLERKFGRFAIPNLMNYIIALYIAGFGLNLISPTFYYEHLSLNAEAILHGQIWRIVTFLMQPPSSGVLFMVFALYLYYMIGRQLEYAWGAFRFNLYILTGVLFHVLAALITFWVTGVSFPLGTSYLNLSLFFAFAALYPDVQFLLFMIIPVKVKYLAWLDAAYFGYAILQAFLPAYGGSVVGIFYKANAIAAFVSILNFLIFFLATRNMKKYSPKEIHRKTVYKKAVKEAKTTYAGGAKHRCAVCGRTELDDDTLEFRYCSKCNGNYEYCQDHLFTHEHVK